jgi:hypothetical protein
VVSFECGSGFNALSTLSNQANQFAINRIDLASDIGKGGKRHHFEPLN